MQLTYFRSSKTNIRKSALQISGKSFLPFVYKGFIALFLGMFALLYSLSASANNLPGEAKVKADTIKAVTNGKVIKVDLDGGWKLEREAGYNFSNVAKQAVIAVKRNNDGSEQSFNAFVIYKRGAPNDAWQFDRLFSFGFKTVGGGASKSVDEAKAFEMTLNDMRQEPGKWMPVSAMYVYRIDNLEIVSGSIKVSGDNELEWSIDLDVVIEDSSQTGLAKVRNRSKVEAIKNPQTGAWIITHGTYYETKKESKPLTRAQLKNLPNLSTTSFDELYFGKK